MSSSMSFFSAALAAVTPSVYSGCACSFTDETIALISSSVMNAPCTRTGLDAPIGR